MLNRAKVMQALQEASEKLFLDFSDEYSVARTTWEQVAHDPLLAYKIQSVSVPWLVPSWQGPLNVSIKAEPMNQPYIVFSVDGSQIYPDRHQGTSCFLINIGTVTLLYKVPGKAVSFSSDPTVFLEHEDELFAGHSTELVNCRRQEFELRVGLEHARLLKTEHPDSPALFLFDGSLIFWHLESKDIELKQTFLSCYLALLHQLYEIDSLIAGYISLPKNKELVNVLRIAACNFDSQKCQTYKGMDHLIDTTVGSFFLEPYTRSTVFKNNSTISQQYPDHLRPYFFYLHVGNEIGRVEIPGWIAQDESKVDHIARSIIDQSIKGQGYPVALAEAHEQAVIKGPDRDFFYHLITKVALTQKKYRALSQKSLKKRGIGI